MRFITFNLFTFLILTVVAFSQNNSSEPIRWEWGQSFSSAGVNTSKMDRAGNVYAVGSCSPTDWLRDGSIFTSTNGQRDTVFRGHNFIVKYNNQGNLEYLAGYLYQDITGLSSHAEFTVDGDGNAYLIVNSYGWSGSVHDTPQGGIKFYTSLSKKNTDSTFVPIGNFQYRMDRETATIIKLNPQGKFEWARVIQSKSTSESSGNDNIQISKIAADNYGNIVIIGEYEGSPVFYNGFNLNSPKRENVLPTTNRADKSPFIAQYSVAGELKWAKSIPPQLPPSLILCDNKQNIIIAGKTAPSNSFVRLDSSIRPISLNSRLISSNFWAKFNKDGKPLSLQKVDGMSINSIAVDSIGSLFFTGSMRTIWNPKPSFYSSNNAVLTISDESLDGSLYLAKYNEQDILSWYSTFSMYSRFLAEYPYPTVSVNRNGDCYYAQRLYGDSLVLANKSKFAPPTNANAWYRNFMILKFDTQSKLLETQISNSATITDGFLSDIGLHLDFSENIFVVGRLDGIFRSYSRWSLRPAEFHIAKIIKFNSSNSQNTSSQSQQLSITGTPEQNNIPPLRGGGSAVFTINVNSNGTNVTDATVTIQDPFSSQARTFQTSAQGTVNYTVNVPTNATNGTYTIRFTASKAGFSASTTVTRTVTIVAPISQSISGRITTSTGAVLADVEVSDGFREGISDNQGNYRISNVPQGSYTITPRKMGYRFTPPQTVVTVNTVSVSNINFSAVLLPSVAFVPPILRSPDDNTVLQDASVRFSWSEYTPLSIPPTPGYDIEIATQADFSPSSIVRTETLFDTHFTISNLERERRYYWRVRISILNVNNTVSTTNWSQVRSFRIAQAAAITGEVFDLRFNFRSGKIERIPFAESPLKFSIYEANRRPIATNIQAENNRFRYSSPNLLIGSRYLVFADYESTVEYNRNRLFLKGSQEISLNTNSEIAINLPATLVKQADTAIRSSARVSFTPSLPLLIDEILCPCEIPGYNIDGSQTFMTDLYRTENDLNEIERNHLELTQRLIFAHKTTDEITTGASKILGFSAQSITDLFDVFLETKEMRDANRQMMQESGLISGFNNWFNALSQRVDQVVQESIIKFAFMAAKALIPKDYSNILERAEIFVEKEFTTEPNEPKKSRIRELGKKELSTAIAFYLQREIFIPQYVAFSQPIFDESAIRRTQNNSYSGASEEAWQKSQEMLQRYKLTVENTESTYETLETVRDITTIIEKFTNLGNFLPFGDIITKSNSLLKSIETVLDGIRIGTTIAAGSISLYQALQSQETLKQTLNTIYFPDMRMLAAIQSTPIPTTNQLRLNKSGTGTELQSENYATIIRQVRELARQGQKEEIIARIQTSLLPADKELSLQMIERQAPIFASATTAALRVQNFLSDYGTLASSTGQLGIARVIFFERLSKYLLDSSFPADSVIRQADRILDLLNQTNARIDNLVQKVPTPDRAILIAQSESTTSSVIRVSQPFTIRTTLRNPTRVTASNISLRFETPSPLITTGTASVKNIGTIPPMGTRFIDWEVVASKETTSTISYFIKVEADSSLAISAPESLEIALPRLQKIDLTSPNNQSLGNSLGSTLRWRKAEGATIYRIQVSASQSFETLALNYIALSRADSVSTNELQSNTQYFWRVKAVNSGGESEWSDVWSFRTGTGGGAVPTGFRLLAPPNNASRISPASVIFRWAAAPSVSYYNLQISTDQSFTHTLLNEFYTDTTRRILDFAINRWYYWRVRHLGGDWSPVWTFYTGTLPANPFGSSNNNAGSGATLSSAQQTTLRSTFTATAADALNVLTLRQHPNPFSNTTTLEYLLPRDAHVRMDICNTLGQVVLSPVNAKQQAGQHTLDVAMNGFPSGVYVVRMNVEGRILTRQMTLLR